MPDHVDLSVDLLKKFCRWRGVACDQSAQSTSGDFSSLLDQPASTPANIEISNARQKRPVVDHDL